MNTAEKALIDAFNQFIESVVKKNDQKMLYIWGASVRGTLLGILLEQKGCSKFLYVDNDERKWGSNINGHLILPSNDMRELRNDEYIVIPIEHYAEIRSQLLSWDMEEEIDFYILKSNLYNEFCADFFRWYNGKYLVMGETFLSSVLLDEMPMESMTDELYSVYGKEDMKILSLGCMGMEEGYYYLQKQIALNARPEKFWLFVNFETLSEHHHLLPRVQHPDLAEMIQERSVGVGPDLTEYIEAGRQRARNYKLEVQHSPRRTYVGEANDIEVQKEYAQKQLLNLISIEYEECLYLSKILDICNKNEIDAAMVIVPVNYQEAEELLGEDFKRIYKENINILSYIGSKYQSKFWDMSKLLEKRFFEARNTLQDGVKREGRQKIVNMLRKYEKGKV